MRHAVQRHLQWLETLHPLPSVTKQIDAIITLVREEEFQSEYQQLFDAISPRISDLLSEGQVEQARTLINRISTLMDQMPAGYWKNRHQSELRRRYGYLLQIEPPREVSLLQLIDEMESS